MRQGGKVGRGELHGERTLASRDEHPLKPFGARVDECRHRLALAERRDSASHVSGEAFGGGRIHHLGPLAFRCLRKGLEVEHGVGGDDGAGRLAVDIRHERLEYLAQLEAEHLGRIDGVAVVHMLRVFVFVQPVGHARLLERLERMGAGLCALLLRHMPTVPAQLRIAPVPSRYDCPVSTLDTADSYRIRQARPEEAEAVHALMVEVATGMDRPELFACDDLPFIRAHLFDPAQGFGLVAVDEGDAIVGALVVRYPGADKDNLGRDAGLAGADLGRVAHMESAVVHPSARGHRLQRRMIDHAEQLIDAHAYPYLFATVAPDNGPSRATLEAAGYRGVARKKKYGGLDRLIVRKDVGAGCGGALASCVEADAERAGIFEADGEGASRVAQEIRYRPMTLADLDAVVELDWTEWFRSGDGPEQLGRMAARLDILTFLRTTTFAHVAECGGRIVGVVLADLWGEAPAIEGRGALRDEADAALRASDQGRAMADELADYHACGAQMAAEVRGECQGEWQLFLVSKAVRGRGVGRELWRRVREYLRDGGVRRYYLYTDSTCPWQIYANHGMVRAAERRGVPDTGGEPSDAFIYVGEPTP